MEIIKNPWIGQDGKFLPYLSLKEFIDLCEQDRLDEIQWLKDMWSSAKKGFGGAYKSWNKEPTEADKALTAQGKDAFYEKFKGASLSAINTVKKYVNQFSNLGLDPVMIITLLGVGVVGGPGAVPTAALLYWTRKQVMKPVMKAAEKVWDKGEELVRKATGTELKKESTILQEWQFQNDFKNYALYKMLVNEGYIDISFQEWLKNPDYQILQEGKILNWLSGMVGKGIGHIAGALSSLAKMAWSVLVNGLPDLIKWAWKNKVAIAKAAYLMTIGYFIGKGVTKITNSVIDKAMSVVRGAGEHTGQIPDQDVDKLQQTVQAKTQAAELSDMQGKVVVNYGSEELAKYGIPTGQIGIPPDVYAQGKSAIMDYLKNKNVPEGVLGSIDRTLPPDSGFSAGMYRTIAGQANAMDKSIGDFAVANQTDMSGLSDAPASSLDSAALAAQTKANALSGAAQTKADAISTAARANAAELAQTAQSKTNAISGAAMSKKDALDQLAQGKMDALGAAKRGATAAEIVNAKRVAAMKAAARFIPRDIENTIDPETGSKLTNIKYAGSIPPR